MKRFILLSLLFCAALAACQDNEQADVADAYAGNASKRVKRITGENNIWGNYRLDFSYNSDGTLKQAWRLDAETNDTTGTIKVAYDLDAYTLSSIDYVPGISPDSIAALKVMYPDTWKDSLRTTLKEQLLCSVELKNGELTKTFNRPRAYLAGGAAYSGDYVKVSSTTQMPDLKDGKPMVIRFIDYAYPGGGNNTMGFAERSIGKYEFDYNGGELVSGVRYLVDTYSPDNWRKVSELNFSSWSGVVTGVESDTYRMRRSKNQVAVAEPGKTYTYTLDEEGVAVRMEASDGETAVYEYEAGSGNFYELFAMPLERVQGKVWVR